MYTRKNIHFESNNVELSGWFYTPTNIQQNEKVPCIIMTHGFSALKEHDLDQFAAYFASHQKCVLVYDNRNFGESGGSPRLEVNPNAQVNDLKHAISYVEKLINVDAKKIALWGTSFSAGVHIVVAAIDKRVRCIVAQVPFVCGYHRFLSPEQYANMQKKYAADEHAQSQGSPPAMLQVVAKEPDAKAIIKGEAAYQTFTRVADWPNQVTLQSLKYSGDFSPIDYIDKIAPTPLLFIVATHDTINATDLALKAFAKAKDPKKLLMIEGDHFDPYQKQFATCVANANAWYDAYLI